MASHILGVFQAAQYIGRASRGGNAHHQVPAGQPDIYEILTAQLRAVLRTLHGFNERPLSAGDQTNHGFRRNTEGGGTLCSVQNAQPSAGARAHVDKPAAGFNRLGRPGNTLGNVIKLGFDGFRDPGVLLVHDGDDFQRGHDVQVHCAAVPGFGGHASEIQTHFITPVLFIVFLLDFSNLSVTMRIYHLTLCVKNFTEMWNFVSPLGFF